MPSISNPLECIDTDFPLVVISGTSAPSKEHVLNSIYLNSDFKLHRVPFNTRKMSILDTVAEILGIEASSSSATLSLMSQSEESQPSFKDVVDVSQYNSSSEDELSNTQQYTENKDAERDLIHKVNSTDSLEISLVDSEQISDHTVKSIDDTSCSSISSVMIIPVSRDTEDSNDSSHLPLPPVPYLPCELIGLVPYRNQTKATESSSVSKSEKSRRVSIKEDRILLDIKNGLQSLGHTLVLVMDAPYIIDPAILKRGGSSRDRRRMKILWEIMGLGIHICLMTLPNEQVKPLVNEDDSKNDIVEAKIDWEWEEIFSRSHLTTKDIARLSSEKLQPLFEKLERSMVTINGRMFRMKKVETVSISLVESRSIKPSPEKEHQEHADHLYTPQQLFHHTVHKNPRLSTNDLIRHISLSTPLSAHRSIHHPYLLYEILMDRLYHRLYAFTAKDWVIHSTALNHTGFLETVFVGMNKDETTIPERIAAGSVLSILISQRFLSNLRQRILKLKGSVWVIDRVVDLMWTGISMCDIRLSGNARTDELIKKDVRKTWNVVSGILNGLSDLMRIWVQVGQNVLEKRKSVLEIVQCLSICLNHYTWIREVEDSTIIGLIVCIVSLSESSLLSGSHHDDKSKSMQNAFFEALFHNEKSLWNALLGLSKEHESNTLRECCRHAMKRLAFIAPRQKVPNPFSVGGQWIDQCKSGMMHPIALNT